MIAAVVIFAIGVLLILFSRGDSGTSSRSWEATPPSHFESQQTSWEKDHFIQKHLHRDDKKHARHKQNQTPW